MIRKIFTISAILLGWEMFSQSNDSIYIPKKIDTDIFKELQWLSPIHAQRLPIANYTISGVDLQFVNQNIKRVQTADKTQNYQFITEGVYRINEKIKVFGDFSFNKQIEKGIAYNLSSQRTQNQFLLSPNYYYSRAKGDWDNQFYQFTGGGSYAITPNLFLGLRVDYQNLLMARNIDPRPKNTGNDMQYMLQLGYQWKEHMASLSFSQRIFKEENQIYYENKTLNTARDPEYYIRFSSGYGFNIYNENFSVYLNKLTSNKFGLDYSYSNSNHFFSLHYFYTKGDQPYYMRNDDSGTNTRPLEEDKYIRYNHFFKTHKMYSFYKHNKQTFPISVFVSFENTQGNNYIATTNSTNALFKTSNFELVAMYDSKRFFDHFGIDIKNQTINVKDYLGSTDKKNSTLDLSIFAQKDFPIKNNKLYTHLGLGVIMPLENQLHYNAVSQDQDFANHVILKDNIFDGTTKFKSSVILGYDLALPKKNTLRIKANYQLLQGKSNENQLDYQIKGTNHFYGLGLMIVY